MKASQLKQLKNNMIAVFEARDKDKDKSTPYHSDFKVLIFDKYGKAITAC